MTYASRSRGDTLSANTDVYLADTIGELGLLYSLAPLSFIGGSIVKHGGQNPIEAVKIGSGVLSGPHIFNFAETYQTLQRYEGCRFVAGAGELAAHVKALFEDPAQAEDMRRRAATAISTLGGALEKTFSALTPYLIKTGLAPAAPEHH